MNLDQLRLHLARPSKTLGVIQELQSLRPRLQLHWQYCPGSTNRQLWHLLEQGAPAGVVLVATTQSAGKGQWKRKWQSPPGGVYLSLGLKPDIPVSLSAYLTLASSWGLVASLRNLGIDAWVKWPNDVVVNGRKLAGVLIETRLEAGLIPDVVIGVGLNGFNEVPDTGISIAQLFQPDLPPYPLKSVESLGAIAIYGILQGYFYWQNYGNSALLNAYEAFMTNIGQIITVEDHLAKVIGVAASGHLRVQPILGHRRLATPVEIEPGRVTLGYNA